MEQTFLGRSSAGLDAPWRRGRAILLIIGTAFAATITHFMAPGVFA